MMYPTLKHTSFFLWFTAGLAAAAQDWTFTLSKTDRGVRVKVAGDASSRLLVLQ